MTGAVVPHRPRKRFGQHFLHDPNVLRRIVAAIRPALSDHVVEIGPGLGALARPLLAAAGELDVVELDRDLLEPMRAGLMHGDLDSMGMVGAFAVGGALAMMAAVMLFRRLSDYFEDFI